jgi:hypothetical protein
MPDSALIAKKYSEHVEVDFEALAGKFCRQRTKICRQEKKFPGQQTGALQAREYLLNRLPGTFTGGVLDLPARKLKSRACEIHFAGSGFQS